MIARVLNLFFEIPYLVQVHEIYNPQDLGGSRINQAILRTEKWALSKATLLIFPVAAVKKFIERDTG